MVPQVVGDVTEAPTITGLWLAVMKVRDLIYATTLPGMDDEQAARVSALVERMVDLADTLARHSPDALATQIADIQREERS